MLKFYYSLAPNPMKVALFLEEVGLPYEPIPVDTRKGEQHTPGFTAINPNAKVPVIVDGSTTVFDSSAILLYLAEKTGQFLPAPEARGELLSWLMFTASGIGPFTGQCVHFKHYAPEPVPYALNRYDYEAWRHWKLIEQRLANREWMLGSATPCWTWPSGAGRVHCPSLLARTPGSSCPTSSGCSMSSMPEPQRSESKRSRSGMRSRPRWTTRRSAPCSPRTSD
jgi:GST-like protein